MTKSAAEQSNRDWTRLSHAKSVKDLDEKLLSFMEGSGVTTTDFSDPKVFGDQPVKLVYKDVWKLAKSFWEDEELADEVSYEEQQIRLVYTWSCIIFE